MAFLKTLALAAALAMPITATYAAMTDISAHAAKAGKKAKKAKKAKGYKHCGTFNYRKAGKCVDARNKK